MPPVDTLAKIKTALSPKPLAPKELDDLFVETTQARDKVFPRRTEIEEILSDEGHRKILLAGHGGTGKSTELVKFMTEHGERYTFIQFSVSVEADPGSLDVAKLLILIAEAVLRRVAELKIKLPEEHLTRIYGWFHETFHVREEQIQFHAEAAGGIDTKGTAFGKLFGLAVTLKSGIKQGTSNIKKVIEKDESSLDQLASFCGMLLRDAAEAIFDQEVSHLILLVEDLDKVNADVAEKIFIDNPAPLSGLPVKSIFTAPISLLYSPRATDLDSHFETITIPMIQVTDPHGENYEPGRCTIREILEKRINLKACIEDEAVELAITKTGGVLRHLFKALQYAATAAIHSGRPEGEASRITTEDVRHSLDRLRADLFQRIRGMGDIETDDLFERLNEFRRSKQAKSDERNLLLMQCHALIEYNGEKWHGIHPLILEKLDELERIEQEGQESP